MYYPQCMKQNSNVFICPDKKQFEYKENHNDDDMKKARKALKRLRRKIKKRINKKKTGKNSNKDRKAQKFKKQKKCKKVKQKEKRNNRKSQKERNRSVKDCLNLIGFYQKHICIAALTINKQTNS